MERIRVIHGDITRLEMDAIVNENNNELTRDDGLIFKIAGPDLLKECQTLGGCKTGEAKMTAGYRSAAGRIIHTVSPPWQDGEQNEVEQLISCYTSSLQFVQENGFTTVAFPLIGGVDNFPLEQAVEIAVRAVAEFLKQNTTVVRFVFVCNDEKTKKAMNREIVKYTPETGNWWDYE